MKSCRPSPNIFMPVASESIIDALDLLTAGPAVYNIQSLSLSFSSLLLYHLRLLQFLHSLRRSVTQLIDSLICELLPLLGLEIITNVVRVGVEVTI